MAPLPLPLRDPSFDSSIVDMSIKELFLCVGIGADCDVLPNAGCDGLGLG